ncbi:MAG: hypothetical protein ACRDJ9_26660 [Dehalococcoidia bacterium]
MTGLGHVPLCLAVSGVVAAVAAAIGWLTLGAPGVLGALAGAAVMASAYLVSALVIVWVDAIDRRLLLPIAMLTYILKIVMLGVVGFAAKQAGWPGLMPMAITAGVVIVLWPLAQLRHVLREDNRESIYRSTADVSEDAQVTAPGQASESGVEQPPQSGGAPRGRRSIA